MRKISPMSPCNVTLARHLEQVRLREEYLRRQWLLALLGRRLLPAEADGRGVEEPGHRLGGHLLEGVQPAGAEVV